MLLQEREAAGQPPDPGMDLVMWAGSGGDELYGEAGNDTLNAGSWLLRFSLAAYKIKVSISRRLE